MGGTALSSAAARGLARDKSVALIQVLPQSNALRRLHETTSQRFWPTELHVLLPLIQTTFNRKLVFLIYGIAEVAAVLAPPQHHALFSEAATATTV
jgi:hypothetical protein